MTRKSHSRGFKVYWKSNQIPSDYKNWIFCCGQNNNFILDQKTQLNVGGGKHEPEGLSGHFQVFSLKSTILTQMMDLHSYSCSASMNPWWLPKTHSLKKHYSVALKGYCVSHLRLTTSALKAEKFKLN